MNHEIIDSIWWTQPGGQIGAVLIKTTEGFFKGYIGIVPGTNKKADEEHIARRGAKLTPAMVNGMFPGLELEKIIT